jgi:MFS family permease
MKISGDGLISFDKGDAQAVRVTLSDIAMGVVIARSAEYFDFFVYAIASVLAFPKAFFPMLGRVDAMLASFAVFSLAFIARPLGTGMFIVVQRRYNRRVKLTMALMLLGTSTTGIALLPGYASLGPLSILMLSVFRIGQGMALGGSWDGLPSLLALNAPAHRRGWYAMVGQLGAPFGFVMAAGMFACLSLTVSEADFADWGWRYPFCAAFGINVVALFARLTLVSTSAYARMLVEQELQPAPFVNTVRAQWRNVVLGAFAVLASYALFHLVTVFPLSWIILYTDRPVGQILLIQIAGAMLAVAGIVLSGWIADRFGRRTMLGLMAVLIGVFSGYLPLLLHGGQSGQDTLVLAGFALLGFSYGQAAGVVTSNMPLKYRYTGAALTYDLVWLVGAGFAPLVALAICAHFGAPYVSLYLLSGSACSLAALYLNRKKPAIP